MKLGAFGNGVCLGRDRVRLLSKRRERQESFERNDTCENRSFVEFGLYGEEEESEAGCDNAEKCMPHVIFLPLYVSAAHRVQIYTCGTYPGFFLFFFLVSLAPTPGLDWTFGARGKSCIGQFYGLLLKKNNPIGFH